jgi:Zn ribbon nucleic-acid-binding protein
MQEGFIIESKLPSRWIAGPPQTSILGTNASGREQRQIASYRCVACGYLELFAQAEIN